ncbi:MAG: hypothetical protein SPK04_00665 [Succinivibrionaceae bacterium]|nr:hypothetical protein [Succinivibrionaceae bacterium]
MQKKVIYLTVMLALGGYFATFNTVNALDLYEDESVEIRGPGGISKVTPPKGVVTHANSKVQDNKVKAQKEKSKALEQPVDVQSKCELAPYPIDIEVPTLTIPKVDLTAITNTIEVMKGEDTFSLVHRSVPDNASKITENMVLAALVRENPTSFNKNGPIAGKKINIPTRERILLEQDRTGGDIFARINSRTLNPNKLPPLELPWENEEKLVKAAQLRKNDRDERVEQINKAYRDCLQKEEDARLAIQRKKEEEKRKAITEASLDDEDLMIKDDEESIVYNEEGKRVIKLKDNSSNNNAANSGNPNDQLNNGTKVNGSSMSFGGNNGVSGNFTSEDKKHLEELKKTSEAQVTQSEELQKKIKEQQAEIEKMRAELIKSNETQKETLELLKQLNNNIDNLANLPHENMAPQKSDDSDNLFMMVACGCALLILGLGGLGLFLVRSRRNKVRNLNDEDDDIDVPESVDIFGTQNKVAPDDPIAQQAQNVATQASTIAPSNLADDLSGLSKEGSKKNGSAPDLTMPDESIPNAGNDLHLDDSSPDLVPSRSEAGESAGVGILDESDFKVDLAKITAHETEPLAPSKVSEIEIPSPSVKSENKDSIELSAETPEPKEAQSDDDVMSAWASAIEESKAPKEEAKQEEPKAEPQSDKDVMDEWAAALNESKEPHEEKEIHVDVPEHVPESDDDVMSAWASAIEESKTPKEEPKAEPQSDKDLMDEWAAALNESKEAKEEPKEAPKSDSDVMDEWAAALAESKDK